MKTTIALFISLIAFSTSAATLENVGKPLKTESISDVSIPIYPETKFQGTTLRLTGAGLREKKVVLVKVNVYHAASYVDLKEGLDVKNPLASLEKCKVRALKLTFLRDLEAEKIRDSFSDALKANGVSVESPAMKQVLAQLIFNVKKGSSLALLGYTKADGTDVVSFELPDKTLQAEGKGIVNDFWKIWFGIPADGGLEDLKEDLLSTKKLLTQP